MWLSSTAQQAVQAVLCIAGSSDEGPVRIDEIAAVLECPRNYLSKTLHILARAGVLRSVRGPRGGFRLAHPPERLTLQRVVAPFEQVGERRCLIGRPRCSDAAPCAAHARWAKVSAGVNEFFNTTTVAQLLRDNPTATSRTRDAVRAARNPNREAPHGSVA